MSDLTGVLHAIEQGDPHAAEQLLPLVYDALRRLAAQKMSQEAAGHTLQATALVHEAWLRLVDVQQAPRWDSRGHFFAAAAEAMRRILVENARRRRSQRRGGERRKLNLLEHDLAVEPPNDDLLALDEALTRLAAVDAEAAQIVQLRVFGGMTSDEAAGQLGISPRTAKRNWAYARAWLRREIDGGTDSQSGS